MYGAYTTGVAGQDRSRGIVTDAETINKVRLSLTTVEPRCTVTSLGSKVDSHLYSKVTLAQSQVIFHSANNMTFSHSNMVTSLTLVVYRQTIDIK